MRKENIALSKIKDVTGSTKHVKLVTVSKYNSKSVRVMQSNKPISLIIKI